MVARSERYSALAHQLESFKKVLKENEDDTELAINGMNESISKKEAEIEHLKESYDGYESFAAFDKKIAKARAECPKFNGILSLMKLSFLNLCMAMN